MDPAHERASAISSLEAALKPLLVQTGSHVLIPPEGVAVGYALRGARDQGGVAAVRIAIQSDTGALQATGPCLFGTDEPVSRAILTAMKFDPVMRSAGIFQYSDRALEVLEDDLFLECASFSIAPAQRGISTMDWGIAFCCKDDVPDVIYEKNPEKEKSRFILFGEDPTDVANNIIICSGRI
jgi:predicted fused transcriptional regulator/phosphomethylpyrimidine kinase